MSKQFSKKTTIIILSFLALLALGLACVIFVLSQKDNNLNWDTIVKRKQPPIVYEELKTTVDTSDWLTYRNEKYGWEISYPKDWKVRDILKESVGFDPIDNSNPHPFVLIEKYPKENVNNLSLEEFRKQLGWANWEYKVKLDDGKMYGVTIDNLYNWNPHVIIDLLKGQNFFEIKYGVNFGEERESYDVFINMLTTFRFYQ